MASDDGQYENIPTTPDNWSNKLLLFEYRLCPVLIAELSQVTKCLKLEKDKDS